MRPARSSARVHSSDTISRVAGLAQSVEHFSCKEDVVGSIPTPGSAEEPDATEARCQTPVMGPGHAHAHPSTREVVPWRWRRRLTVAAIVVGVLTAVGLAVLWPRHDVTADVEQLGLIEDVHQAEVLSVRRVLCAGTAASGIRVECERARFRLDGGPDRGEVRVIEFADAPNQPDLAPGDLVVLNHVDDAAPGFEYTYADRQRRPVLLWLTALFAVAVIALGRWRGLGALVGLGVSIVVVLQFVVPSMLAGNSPALVAIVGASAIAFFALYLANGVRAMTTVALLATIAALAVTVALAMVFTELAHFSGVVDEDSLLLQFGASSVDVQGLVLAGMLLGALGALDDVTVTQASAVAELRRADPAASRRDLYRAGVRVGRDHVASAVNTLALAYAGAALPILILFSLSGRSLGAVANGELVAVPIVSALVGSIGLVCAVPISTGFATLVATARGRGARPAGRPPDG